jgi:galactokinase
MISDNLLAKLYGADALPPQKKRYEKAFETFRSLYGADGGIQVFSAPGRTEIGGNHTDHNGGRVIAAAVGLDAIAFVSPAGDDKVIIESEGFPRDCVDITDLSVREDEKNTSAALVRGVSAGFVRNGYNIGGFKAYTTSNVLKGSGLSSSAAFETLIGTVFSHIYNGGGVDPARIAKIGQYAENVYFGKPSGLMDQMASSVGGFVAMDFGDGENPVTETIDCDFEKSGYGLCVIDTRGDHAGKTHLYAAIPDEMKSVARCLGGRALRDVRREDLMKNLPAVREACGDRAVLRALHFFDEDERAANMASALKSGDFGEFLKLVNESGDSSHKYLQNVCAPEEPREQGLALGLYAAAGFLNGTGAVRVHGGGFAGTVQAYVPLGALERFISEMDGVFGAGSCQSLYIRPCGGVRVC